jgi:hypothetical protein
MALCIEGSIGSKKRSRRENSVEEMLHLHCHSYRSSQEVMGLWKMDALFRATKLSSRVGLNCEELRPSSGPQYFNLTDGKEL